MEYRQEKIKRGITPLLWALGAFAFMIAIGSFGFMFLDGHFNFLDSLYMTVITVSTVGFHEVHPLTEEAKIFTIFLILCSVIIYGSMVSTVTVYIIEGAFQKNLKKYRVNKKIKKLEGHVIVCGFGRNGKQASADLYEHGYPFVVVDKEDSRIEEIEMLENYICLKGDATDEEILSLAGIKSAKALITAMPSDAVNIFIVLTARELNPKLKIISRCSDARAESKLRRAGADNIIMPDIVGGQKMARLIAQPDIVEFLDKILLQATSEVNLEEISCECIQSESKGKTIKELNVRGELGVNIIGIKNEQGEYLYNPPGNTVLTPGKQLFVLGNPHQISSFRKLLSAELEK